MSVVVQNEADVFPVPRLDGQCLLFAKDVKQHQRPHSKSVLTMECLYTSIIRVHVLTNGTLTVLDNSRSYSGFQ